MCLGHRTYFLFMGFELNLFIVLDLPEGKLGVEGMYNRDRERCDNLTTMTFGYWSTAKGYAIGTAV